MQKTRERRITRVRVCVSRATLILLKQIFQRAAIQLENKKGATKGRYRLRLLRDADAMAKSTRVLQHHAVCP